MPHNVPIPEDHFRQMADAYVAGATQQEAAAAFGYCAGSCLNALRRYGIPARGHLPEGTGEEVLRAYNAGESMASIARRLGVEHTSCWHAFRRLGGKSRSYPRLDKFNQTYFESVATEEQAYWLGFCTADAGIEQSKTNARLKLQLCGQDEGHLEKFKTAIGSVAKVRRYIETREGKSFKKSSYESAEIRVSSVKLIADLASLGVGPRKSFVVEPWRGPAQLMRHYWRGVVDGDGSVRRDDDKGKRQWEVMLVGNRMMVEGFATFVAPTIGKTPSVTAMGTIFKTRCRGLALPQKVAILLYEGAAVFLDRKKEEADRLIQATAIHADHSDLTAEKLMELRQIEGSWKAVARRIGIHASSVIHRVRMFSLPTLLPTS